MSTRLLRALGIHPRHYWLLMDLFGQLSERRELLNQLGRDAVGLKTLAWFYFVFTALASILLVLGRPPVETYFASFQVISVFFLGSVLMPETSNSLVNPVEGLVLAHQPIDGATYTAAKLTHLLRIVLYLVPGLNLVPALGGLVLEESGWLYPVWHLLAAFGVGLVLALLCCAVFGWLIRFVPASRLKTAGQYAEMAPLLAMLLLPYAREFLARTEVVHWLPAGTAPRAVLVVALGVVVFASVVFGIRSLSGDYLIRVSSIVQGAPAGKAKVRRSRMGDVVARLFGGPASRAGFEYVSRMMLRDWQFKKQILFPLIFLAGAPVLWAIRGQWTSPFSGAFTGAHVMPHLFGVLLFWACSFLAFGSHHKGIWIFLLAPAQAFGRFARGVYALLLIKVIMVPHLIVLVLLSWYWGIADAGLFVAYSIAISALYLGLNLRRIDGVPFGKQPEAARAAVTMPLMMGGGLVIAIAVAVQHFLLFRSSSIVLLTTIVVAVAAHVVARGSVEAFGVSIRYHLGLVSAESDLLYREVEV